MPKHTTIFCRMLRSSTNFEASSTANPQRALQTATRDLTLPSRLCVSLLIFTCSFVTFTNKREKSVRRQGHPCLRFFHDFVSAVFKTRNSCRWRHFSTKRTAMRPLRVQNLRGSKPPNLETCFDLYSIISGEPSACNTVVFNLFTLVQTPFMTPFLQFQHQRERKPTWCTCR